MQTPRTSHWNALIHTLNYVYNTTIQGILLNGETNIILQAYTDSDWGACCAARRSVLGYLLLLGKYSISWKSKKQHIVSKSNAEAEYRAMSNAASEVT